MCEIQIERPVEYMYDQYSCYVAGKLCMQLLFVYFKGITTLSDIIF